MSTLIDHTNSYLDAWLTDVTFVTIDGALIQTFQALITFVQIKAVTKSLGLKENAFDIL